MVAEPTRTDEADVDAAYASRPADLWTHYAELVGTELNRVLATHADGEFGSLVASYPSRPAKRLRPALLLATCEAFGGDVRDALPAAVSLELMHNAFLVHDDIEDASTRRRGRPALHIEHGVPLAVHAGDALAVRAVLPLLDQPRLSQSLVQRITREFLDTASRTLEGQSMELSMRRDHTRSLDLDAYLRLVLYKSCWYTTIYPLRAGALIGSRGLASLGPLTAFGFLLGAAFQVRDDLLDVSGDPEQHGKEQFSDLREGKQTLMLSHLEQAAPPDDRCWLDALYARPLPERTDDDIARVYELMCAHGSIAAASAWAFGLAAAARAALEPAFARAQSRFHVRYVAELIDFVVTRSM